MWVSPRYRIVAEIPVQPLFGDLQLRQSYITPHFRKCSAVVPLKLHLMPRTAARPHGFPKQALCKIAYADPGLSAACTPQPLRVLRAVACRPRGVLALGHQSGALRIGLVSGFAVYVVFAPTHPWGLLASQHRPPARSARLPPRGSLRTARVWPERGCNSRRYLTLCFFWCDSRISTKRYKVISSIESYA